jgi:hypothetical protein
MQRAIGTYPYRHGTRHACRVYPLSFFLNTSLKGGGGGGWARLTTVLLY